MVILKWGKYIIKPNTKLEGYEAIGAIRFEDSIMEANLSINKSRFRDNFSIRNVYRFMGYLYFM